MATAMYTSGISFDEQYELDFLNGTYNGNTDRPVTEKDIYDAFNF